MADANLSSFIWSVADLLRGNYKQSEHGKVMFYNTGISTYVWVVSNRKPAHRKGARAAH
jgi:type I restriction enzyme M protein